MLALLASVALLVSAWIETYELDNPKFVPQVALLVSAWIETTKQAEAMFDDKSHSS